MELEILERFAEQWVTVILLIIFVYFFLTEFNKSQKEMVKMMGKLIESQRQMLSMGTKQTALIEKLISKLDRIWSK